MQAVIADALQECRVGIEQAVEPVDQDAGRQQIEQRAVAPAFAARRRLGRRQPFRARCGLLARRLRRGGLGRRSPSPRPHHGSPAAGGSVSSRADSCRASSLKAWFSTGDSAGDCDFASPIGRNGTTFGGVSTGSSKSVGGEMGHRQSRRGGPGGMGRISSISPGGCAAAACSDFAGTMSAARDRAVASSMSPDNSSRRSSARYLQAVEIAAHAKAAIAGKLPVVVMTSAIPTARPPAGRRHRPANTA